jgi:ABC-type nitrate/sulfonate/bicarbonate transport system substrate-binding protein
MIKLIRTVLCATILSVGAVAIPSAASAQDLPKVDIVVFTPPSLGAFLVPIVKQRKFDTKNGIDINFVQRSTDAYISEFNSGEFQVGGSASLLSVAVASSRGVKVAYLFNLFDYFGAVVTDHPDIKTVKDLEGKKLVAAASTTNFAMFKWLAMNQGVNVSRISVQNTSTPGLVGYALADRADAVQLWEPGYSILLNKKPSMRTLDLKIGQSWKKFAGTEHIPYLGVAAHLDWIKKNPELVNKMYAAFKDAADWLRANPEEGGKMIAASIKGSDPTVIINLIKDNIRLGLNVDTAGDMEKGIRAVYAAGHKIGYLTKEVSESTIYKGIKTK